MHRKFRLLFLSLLIIVSLLLNAFLGVAVLALGDDLYEKDMTIAELNKGAEIDYKYVNEIYNYDSSLYDLWQSCNNSLSSVIGGNMNARELEKFVVSYREQTHNVASIAAKVSEMKKNRSEEFSKFEHAEIYKPAK